MISAERLRVIVFCSSENLSLPVKHMMVKVHKFTNLKKCRKESYEESPAA